MLIKNGNLINVKTGEVVSTAHVYIHGGKIASIQNSSIPAGIEDEEEIIDLKGNYIIPGLIDCHVHLVWDGSDDPNAKILNMDDNLMAIYMAKHAEETLRLGITTIRDTGSPRNVGFAVRDAVRQGVVSGPNFLISGPPICMTGGHVYTLGMESDGVDEVRKSARTLLKKGVDVVKLMASGGVYSEGEEPASAQLTVEEMKVAVEEAHKRNVRVSAHAEGITGIMNALKAGVDTIEHANLANEEAWDIFIKQGTYFITTLLTFKAIAEMGTECGALDYAVRKAQKLHSEHLKNFRRAVEKGVKIAVGTDCQSIRMPESRYFEELLLMIQNGMSKLGTLQAATINAAEALGIENEVGSLEVGKKADIVILSGNPLEDMNLIDKVQMVIKDGNLIR